MLFWKLYIIYIFKFALLFFVLYVFMWCEFKALSRMIVNVTNLLADLLKLKDELKEYFKGLEEELTLNTSSGQISPLSTLYYGGGPCRHGSRS